MSRRARSRRARRRSQPHKGPPTVDAGDFPPYGGHPLFESAGELHYAVGFTSGGAPYGMPVSALERDFDGSLYVSDYAPADNDPEIAD
jgi:hypothetical protein